MDWFIIFSLVSGDGRKLQIKFYYLFISRTTLFIQTKSYGKKLKIFSTTNSKKRDDQFSPVYIHNIVQLFFVDSDMEVGTKPSNQL